MRLSRILFIIAGFALMLLSSRALPAQELTPRSGGSAGAAVLRGPGVVGKGCSEAEPRNRTIEPYTATRKTTRVQTLANGITITQESTGREARDSSGRTYHETQSEGPFGFEGQPAAISYFHVFDPANRVSINWSSNSKEATVYHMPDPVPARQAPPPAANSAATVQPVRIPRPARPRGEMEDLGARTINGIDAKGRRTTETFPAGSFGNDQPLTVSHEVWMSPELGLPVLQIDDDPRTGVRTTELTEIERGEPDPALFQPPEGYTIKDQYPNQRN
jgi:hypothetical protein